MLTPEDAEAILANAALRDGRTWPTEETFRLAAACWAADLDDPWLTPGIAAEALKRHYRADSRRIMPADLLAHAENIRRERLALVRMPDPPPGLTADPALYAEALTAAETAILAGEDPAPAMAAVAARLRPELTGGWTGRPLAAGDAR